MTLLLPQRYIREEMQIIAKTDEHYDSMVHDEDFYTDMQRENTKANQMMNLNNADLTKAGDNAAQNATILVANTNEDWLNKKWRPLMGYVYMVICICDFIVFPILWSGFQAYSKGSVTTPWQPITLQGAGLLHLAFGAVLGISSFGRTQEKLAGASTVDTSTLTGK